MAAESLLISVEDADIRKANSRRTSSDWKSWNECVVATAVARITGRKPKDIFCGEYQLHVGKAAYYLPDEAAVYIRRFMRGEPVAPASFTAIGA